MQSNAEILEEIKVPRHSLWHRMPVASFLLGLVCCSYWFFTYKADPSRAMYSYLFAYVSVLSLVLGAMFYVLLQHSTRAGWSIATRRVAEFIMATVPLMVLLFLPIVFGMKDIYSWTHIAPDDHVLQGKTPYLNIQFFLARAAVYLVSWLIISIWFFNRSVEQDTTKKGEDSRKMIAASPLAIILLSLTLTFASIDWIMTLQPHWYSTIFGVYYFAGCLLSGIAMITLVLLGLQASGALKHTVTKEHYQDLGKLMFGFTVFWAYIAFSQFMLYWYSNIPEETEFYIHRLSHGWQYYSYALPLTNFFLPFFFMMSRHVKRNKIALALFCVWIIVTHFFDLYWIIMPNYGAHGLPEGAHVPHAHFTMSDFTITLGQFLLMFAYVSYFVVRRKIVPIGDPRLSESLAFENG